MMDNVTGKLIKKFNLPCINCGGEMMLAIGHTSFDSFIYCTKCSYGRGGFFKFRNFNFCLS